MRMRRGQPYDPNECRRKGRGLPFGAGLDWRGVRRRGFVKQRERKLFGRHVLFAHNFFEVGDDVRVAGGDVRFFRRIQRQIIKFCGRSDGLLGVFQQMPTDELPIADAHGQLAADAMIFTIEKGTRGLLAPKQRDRETNAIHAFGHRSGRAGKLKQSREPILEACHAVGGRSCGNVAFQETINGSRMPPS